MAPPEVEGKDHRRNLYAPKASPYADEMKGRKFFGFALVVLVGLSPVAKAETVHPGGDGYFCASKGYLAFDYNQTEVNGSAVKKTHSLRIVRFGPEHRIYFAGEVGLSTEFSILVMDCDGERVKMFGQLWPRGKKWSLAKCDVRIGSPTTPIGSADCNDDIGGTYPTKKSPNLEIQSENDPPPITLESSADTGRAYQLRRHLAREPIPGGGMNWTTEAEVVELDQKGTVLDRVVIYEYVRLEPGD
jgi:hypothetical protein